MRSSITALASGRRSVGWSLLRAGSARCSRGPVRCGGGRRMSPAGAADRRSAIVASARGCAVATARRPQRTLGTGCAEGATPGVPFFWFLFLGKQEKGPALGSGWKPCAPTTIALPPKARRERNAGRMPCVGKRIGRNRISHPHVRAGLMPSSAVGGSPRVGFHFRAAHRRKRSRYRYTTGVVYNVNN